VSTTQGPLATECGATATVQYLPDASVRYRCDLSEGHDGPHNNFFGLYQWTQPSTRPSNDCPDAAS
jgi:hypothetical protein